MSKEIKSKPIIFKIIEKRRQTEKPKQDTLLLDLKLIGSRIADFEGREKISEMLKLKNEVKFRFNKYSKRAILAGTKTIEVKIRKYGEAGDYFMYRHHTFVFTEVKEIKLSEAITKYFKEEGFNTSEEFQKFWHQMYPAMYRHPYWDDYVWAHTFKKVE